jgi:hypothetical protein
LASNGDAGGDLVRTRVAAPPAHGSGVASGRDQNPEYDEHDQARPQLQHRHGHPTAASPVPYAERMGAAIRVP